MAKFKTDAYIKFIMYMVVVVLINIAGLTLFFRVDLTENGLYSLSKASKEAVSSLSEPLTIDVFFTKNLPSPHNNTRQYLNDLLEEYAIYSNKNFNFRFYDVSTDEGGKENSKTEENRKMAENYGIYPVEIRMLDQDEIKFKKAYMGLALIHGDLIEKIPAITSTEGLEYRLTTAITKLNNKISKLASLPGKVDIKMYMSSSIKQVADYMGVEDIKHLPDAVKGAVDRLNGMNYGKLSYAYIDPPANQIDSLTEKNNLMSLTWPDIPQENIKAGRAVIGMVMSYQGEKAPIHLLNVVRIPIIGTRYELVDMDSLKDIINENVESLIGINENIGYLSDHGTLELPNPLAMMQGGGGGDLNNFKTLVSQNYSFKQISLDDQRIPESLNTLIIAHPTEKFSDYALYQIDQALMRGTNIILFSDAFNEVKAPRQQFAFNPGPSYQVLDTGLEKLLKHYGVDIEPAYVMDKNCYHQQTRSRSNGGGGDQPIYFAPTIKNDNINHTLSFINNIKGLITLDNSPVNVDKEILSKYKLTAKPLFSSSDQSWEMKGRINLNPMFIQPPTDKKKFGQYSLAYLVEGRFPSYFAGKPVPEKPEKNPADSSKDIKPDTPDAGKAASTPDAEATKVESAPATIDRGKPAKLLVVGSSALLKDNLLDQEGQTPNATFVLNAIDYLNGRTDITALRSKTQRFNPLEETDAQTKYTAKIFNIAGLPVLVALFGLFVLWRRRQRRKQIQMMFQN